MRNPEIGDHRELGLSALSYSLEDTVGPWHAIVAYGGNVVMVVLMWCGGDDDGCSD